MLKFITCVFTPSAVTLEAIAKLEERWVLTDQGDAEAILVKVVEGKLPVSDAVEILREYLFVFTPEFAEWFADLPYQARAELFDYLLLAGVELRAKLRHLQTTLSADVGASSNHPYLIVKNWDMEMEALRPFTARKTYSKAANDEQAAAAL